MWQVKLLGGALLLGACGAAGVQLSLHARRRQAALLQLCALLREVCHGLRNRLPTELVWQQSLRAVPPRWAGQWQAGAFIPGKALQKEAPWLALSLAWVGRVPAQDACRRLLLCVSRLERIQRREEASAKRVQALALPCSICLGLLLILWLF